MGVHKLQSGMQEADVRNGWEGYKSSAIAAGLRPISVIVSLEKGFAYCQTEAQSAEDVRTAHANVTIPLEDVVEVKTLE